ncbi:Golgi membrane protein 1 isoform X2 [Scleropages formosus]|uniref:Golgi membrane protein 1 isoform X2 n=1 Tax=Scleropages formosus TaxID=113540 RepID=UPI00087819F8|nr:Golgi membrane protein 1 isoform X2 [Scleropages formosus]
MGALGNSRRGGRTPPLLIGALIACIIVLGFNYWVSNSRNAELQTKLYELEGIVRRAVAERGAVEKKKNEFQDELRRQGEQITRIENQHSSQLEEARATWKEEKEKLLLNISSSTKTILTIKGQFNELSENLEKIQKKLQDCEKTDSSLKKRITEEQAQCKSQLQSVKDECTAKLAATKQKAELMTKNNNSPLPTHSQEPPTPPEAKATKEEDAMKKPEQGNPEKGSAQKQKEERSSVQAQGQPLSENIKLQELENNEIIEAKDAKAVDKGAVELGNKAANSTEGNDLEVFDIHGTDFKAEDTEDGRVQEKAVKEEDIADYNGDEQNIGESEVDKEVQLTGNAGKEEDKVQLEADVEGPADYNGDEDNEGEFEADKQMELSEM